jgi:hypothetical protein
MSFALILSSLLSTLFMFSLLDHEYGTEISINS